MQDPDAEIKPPEITPQEALPQESRAETLSKFDLALQDATYFLTFRLFGFAAVSLSTSNMSCLLQGSKFGLVNLLAS